MHRKLREQERERGAALVEMALVLPLLVLLVFGIFEFGITFRDRLTISNGTQSAGRVAAALGSNDDADMAVLQSVEQSLGLLPNSGGDVIKHVWIWKSDGAGNPIGGGCGGGNGTSTCNWYRYDPTEPCGWTPCPDPNSATPSNDATYGGGYVPSSRDVTLDDDGLDVIGVTVLFSHEWITGVLPLSDVECNANGTDCWADTSLFRLEPLNFGN